MMLRWQEGPLGEARKTKAKQRGPLPPGGSITGILQTLGLQGGHRPQA